MKNMTADGSSGALYLSIKFGLLSLVVSAISVLLGFSVVPLTPGKETRDAAKRLAAGLLTAFIFGPPMTAYIISTMPAYLDLWKGMAGTGEFASQTAYLLAAMPMLALCSLVGFWVVAAIMKFFTSRKGKDVIQIASDAIRFARASRRQ